MPRSRIRDTETRISLKIWSSFLAATTALLILGFMPASNNTLFWRELNNAGHAPFFGLLALVFLTVLHPKAREGGMSREGQYLLAFVLSVLAGALVETIQHLTPRYADFVDLLNDGIGAASFLAFYSTLDKGNRGMWVQSTTRLKIAVRVLAVCLLLVTLVSPALWAVSYLKRQQTFPEICGFDSYWQNRFIVLEDSSLRIINPPPGWQNAPTDKVAELTLQPSPYPGLTVTEPFPDWSDYTYFYFEVFSELERPVKMGLRISDIVHDHQSDDRFNLKIIVHSGLNRISIPMDSIHSAPKTRKMDLAKIAEFKLFAYGPGESFTIYINDFCLRQDQGQAVNRVDSFAAVHLTQANSVNPLLAKTSGTLGCVQAVSRRTSAQANHWTDTPELVRSMQNNYSSK